jgi:ABC-type dipeptide/oligopeptide/nickel transport system ATPase component
LTSSSAARWLSTLVSGGAPTDIRCMVNRANANLVGARHGPLPPRVIDPPSGCAFHPRCPRAVKGTRDKEVPRLEDTGKGSHRVTCWNPYVD